MAMATYTDNNRDFHTHCPSLLEEYGCWEELARQPHSAHTVADKLFSPKSTRKILEDSFGLLWTTAPSLCELCLGLDQLGSKASLEGIALIVTFYVCLWVYNLSPAFSPLCELYRYFYLIWYQLFLNFTYIKYICIPLKKKSFFGFVVLLLLFCLFLLGSDWT